MRGTAECPRRGRRLELDDMALAWEAFPLAIRLAGISESGPTESDEEVPSPRSDARRSGCTWTANRDFTNNVRPLLGTQFTTRPVSTAKPVSATEEGRDEDMNSITFHRAHANRTLDFGGFYRKRATKSSTSTLLG
ncbi:hypothetical protein [Amycolatopsis thailandensis]|uniref:hypothetical protein n=1 Tax=Amycolatopsis thailandensis TaxID=589330 RepID=UPI0036356A62